MKIALLTLVIGEKYREAVKIGIDSKTKAGVINKNHKGMSACLI